MNTDVRRRIFVAMMGADDFVDAHARVVRLKLAKAQQPEIVRVLLECCGQEGVFNRFYALLGARLCESHREVRFAMNFAFWDVFKQLSELSLHRAANTARLLAQLVLKSATPVTVLKVVHWTSPSARTVFFWQVFFVELLDANEAGGPGSTLLRDASAPLLEPKHVEVREGVLLFCERHLRRMVAKQHKKLLRGLDAMVALLESTAY
jgi:nucleolar MIF4G domain-containing protein 1